MATLRECRLDTGLTREALAAQARCSVAMLQMLEGGYRPARSAVLRRVVAVISAETGADYAELLSTVACSGADPTDERRPAGEPSVPKVVPGDRDAGYQHA